ncbi:MAG: hypothetical protein GX670_05475 [Bacteroidales bacterium]|nr:hypothetical protein [Bacteroidales bacterium]
MKKIIITLGILFAAVAISTAQEKGIIAEVLRNSVELKVDSMQEIIGFEDKVALKLKELELKYLFDVQKAETCFLCNTSKRIKKLQSAREERLQEILPRDQYVKYYSIENDLINIDTPIWSID